MSKQSSIDWLISQYKKQGFFYDLDIEAAKAMHKEEIVEHHTWLLSGVINEESARKDGEDYYNQTFEQ